MANDDWRATGWRTGSRPYCCVPAIRELPYGRFWKESRVSVKRSAPSVMAELLILAGLRNAEDTIRDEAKQMPILNDIMDNKVLGPVLREGMELGRAAGHTEGERHVILRLLLQRFGHLPDWARNRLEKMTAAEIDLITVRLFDAANLEDLLR